MSSLSKTLMLVAVSTAAASAEGLLVQASAAHHRAFRQLSNGISSSSRKSTSAAAYASAAAASFFNNSNHRRLARSTGALSPGHHHSSRTFATTMSSPLPTVAGAAATRASRVTLDSLPFDNAAIRELPIDDEPDNFIRSVPNACFSAVAPDPVVKPVLVAASSSALELLGLGTEESQREDFAEYFSGKLLDGLVDFFRG